MPRTTRTSLIWAGVIQPWPWDASRVNPRNPWYLHEELAELLGLRRRYLPVGNSHILEGAGFDYEEDPEEVDREEAMLLLAGERTCLVW